MFKYDLDPVKRYTLTKSPQLDLDFAYTQYPIAAYVKSGIANDTALYPVGGKKPEGIWYSLGRSWLDWSQANFPSPQGVDESKLNPLFEIEVNTDKFICLKSAEDITNFHNKHSVNGDDTTINWLEVSKLYDGIEINPFNRELSNLYWYRTYDVSSGCVWNLKTITKVTRINKIYAE